MQEVFTVFKNQHFLEKNRGFMFEPVNIVVI